MDRSRSTLAFRVGKHAVQNGADFEQMCQTIRDDAETADWYREKGTAANGRELKRIFDKAKEAGPLIRVVAGGLHITASEGEAALIAAGLPIYQRGHHLVRPIMQEVPAAKGRMTVAASLVEVSLPNMVDLLCGVAAWEKYDGRAEDWVRTNPPKQVAETILSRVAGGCSPRSSASSPRPRSTRTARFCLPPAMMPQPGSTTRQTRTSGCMPWRITRPAKAAEQGLAQLSDLLAEFPFVGGQQSISKAVALSALITPVVRGALSVAPMHVFRASTAGTGKSYLADTSSAISSGRPCPVAAAGQDEAETEKRLAGLLLAGFPLISLDNINGGWAATCFAKP